MQELVKPVINDNENIVAGNVKPFDKKVVNTISEERFKEKYLSEAPTINLLFRREVFKKIGLFNIKYAFGEDVDITWRSINAGYKIRYANKALIYHNWGNLITQSVRMIKYGKVRVYLYIDHPDKIKSLIKNESIVVLIYPLFLLLLPLSIIFPYYLLLLVVPILKNWNHNPFFVVFFNLLFGFGEIGRASCRERV